MVLLISCTTDPCIRSDSKDMCYLELVSYREGIKDPGICLRIEDQSTRLACLEFTDFSESHCRSFSGEYRSLCTARVAERAGDLALCRGIKEADVLDRCLFDVLSRNRIVEPSVCDEMRSPKYRFWCFGMQDRTKIDESFCTSLEGSDRDNCYSFAARNLLDYSLCNQMEEKDLCRWWFGKVMNATFCEEIDDEGLKDSCLRLSDAPVDRDYMINLSQGERDDYLLLGAIRDKDPDLCEEIAFPRWRGFCLSRVG